THASSSTTCANSERNPLRRLRDGGLRGREGSIDTGLGNGEDALSDQVLEVAEAQFHRPTIREEHLKGRSLLPVQVPLFVHPVSLLAFSSGQRLGVDGWFAVEGERQNYHRSCGRLRLQDHYEVVAFAPDAQHFSIMKANPASS